MMTMPNKALHRTAICVWVFALEFLVFISQFVAVGELGLCQFLLHVRAVKSKMLSEKSMIPILAETEQLIRIFFTSILTAEQNAK